MTTKDDIISYVKHTPENTNPGILKSMLDELGGGSSGGDVTVNIYKATVTDDDDVTALTLESTVTGHPGSIFNLSTLVEASLQYAFLCKSTDVTDGYGWFLGGTGFEISIIPDLDAINTSLNKTFDGVAYVIFNGR